MARERESKSAKKRRGDDDRDDRRRDRSHSDSPPREKRSTRRHSRSRSPEQLESRGGGALESASIEETNKMRAQLGLAPLELDDGPKVREADSGVMTDKIVKEDGMEFRHRKAENWADKKQAEEMRVKLEVAKKKREVYSKVLKSKRLADSDSDDDATNWVEKVRKQEEEKKKAADRAKMLDQMDEDFGVNTLIEDEKAKQARKKAKQKRAAREAVTANLVVGHDKEVFLGGQDQILVLEDKGVLDDGEEVLINPNLVDAERTKRNVELKKKKGATATFDDDLDEWGNPRDKGVLSKYDDDEEGVKRSTFRLDEKGQVDFEQERQEEAMRRRLMMAGKTLVSLDDSNKFNKANEFYTQEEMISFRKTKKSKDGKKLRKRKEKGLKADDLVPVEPAGGSDLGNRNRRRRRNSGMEEGESENDDVKPEVKMEAEAEEGELPEDGRGSKWKRATKGDVDLDKLKKIVQKEMDSEDDSDDEMMGPRGIDLTDVVLDDDAQDELAMMLDKARRLKQMEAKKDVADPEAVAKRVYERIERENPVKMEIEEDGNEVTVKEELDDGMVLIDSTHEYCRNIGDIPTYGLAGNRNDAIDLSEMDARRPNMDDEEDMSETKLEEWKRAQAERAGHPNKGGWHEASTSEAKLDSDDEDALRSAKEYKEAQESGSDEEEKDSDDEHNVLGEEADTTKGVGAMLKLAAQKGYLNDPNAKKTSGENLDHLKNQRFTQMETAKYDIEEKYTKKLEKMGTTGRGPTFDFSEKKDYKPEINIHYVDEKGRELEPKDAFRKLSWKFHGKCPGKKQIEKRARRMDQREMLKKMDSSDTPLGTLSKQLKKQEQLQTPYLVLSGNSSHSNFKKE